MNGDRRLAEIHLSLRNLVDIYFYCKYLWGEGVIAQHIWFSYSQAKRGKINTDINWAQGGGGGGGSEYEK